VSGPQGSIEPMVAAEDPIDPRLRVGHVHLRTPDIDRVREFYVGIMGFDVVFEARNVPGWGTTGDVLFLSAGGYHHHPRLQHVEVGRRPAAARWGDGPASGGAELLDSRRVVEDRAPGAVSRIRQRQNRP
jgi:catechol 2,3-dioxygenase-like lactoylglutathione lyase family enzyme